ncbi:hypothetical protein LOTGIDRAFT_175578 [Lottia gigantea]|uniref:Uncharacterized protein n=1 Tax=Lottia gigantea TaxID=225164 RepID=V4BVW1_LOTGI|nr:hypothetical protein LOTGIDRAFT_175578 [Lottia gigantea]ESO93194.1 hypothetical protein LOTGIDRAFT_175578 [Lottia gigantea]
MANKVKLESIYNQYKPIEYRFNKTKEDYIIISPTVDSKSQINDGDRVTFEINSLSNWLLLSDAYFRCDITIKDGTAHQNRIPQQNVTLEHELLLLPGEHNFIIIKSLKISNKIAYSQNIFRLRRHSKISKLNFQDFLGLNIRAKNISQGITTLAQELDLRLDSSDIPKPGEEPINRIDQAARKHDVLYRLRI